MEAGSSPRPLSRARPSRPSLRGEGRSLRSVFVRGGCPGCPGWQGVAEGCLLLVALTEWPPQATHHGHLAGQVSSKPEMRYRPSEPVAQGVDTGATSVLAGRAPAKLSQLVICTACAPRKSRENKAVLTAVKNSGDPRPAPLLAGCPNIYTGR